MYNERILSEIFGRKSAFGSLALPEKQLRSLAVTGNLLDARPSNATVSLCVHYSSMHSRSRSQSLVLEHCVRLRMCVLESGALQRTVAFFESQTSLALRCVTLSIEPVVRRALFVCRQQSVYLFF